MTLCTLSRVIASLTNSNGKTIRPLIWSGDRDMHGEGDLTQMKTDNYAEKDR